MRAARTDANQAAIVSALEAAGWAVFSTASVGRGFPDLVCHRRGAIRLVEVKTATGKLRPAQEKFQDMFPVSVVRTIEDAVRLS